MPTGVVPTSDGRLLVVMDDGLRLVDPDRQVETLVARYPDELGGRANDACADLSGNVITGRLNLGPDEGSAWWWSATDGWRLIDPAISNTNGPAALDLDGTPSLIVGDTAADYFAYDYDAATGSVGPRRVFASVEDLDGHPDGGTVDAEGGYWCAVVGGSVVARFTSAGLDQTVELPTANPTDVTFGGEDLDRMFVTAIDGPLYVVDGLGVTGRPEPRARMHGRAGPASDHDG